MTTTSAIAVVAVLLLFSVSIVHALPACGNGVIDTGETCDRALVTCCNATCTGPYDVATIEFPVQTCYNGPANYAQLYPFIADPSLTFEWVFLETPAGSAPIIYTPTLQTTYFHLQSNGYYRLAVHITTPLCGSYYTDDLEFEVDDCCGNNVIDNDEQCDFSIDDNGCCDHVYCVFEVEGTPCSGDITDQCTHALSCNADGLCVSDEDSAFSVTPLQSTSIIDTACSMDVRQFNFQTSFEDVDNTPGLYYWNVVVLENAPIATHSIVNARGSLSGPSGTITFGVRMVGGGDIQVRLDIEDSCGLVISTYYNVTRECCGNLVLNTGETCDDGNTLDGDYCSSDCTQNTGWCGDSIVQDNEMCDYKLSSCCATTCQSILPSSTVCRASAGTCDIAESCTGTSPDCPVDSFKPPNVTCRNALGVCDAPETCSGYDPLCPNQNAPFPSTVMCRTPNGECTLPTYCDGLSFGCPGVQYRNTTCRLPTGPCDVAEYCTAGNAQCPVNAFALSNKTCIIDGTLCMQNLGECSGTDATCQLTALPQSCPEPGPIPPVPVNLSACISTSCLEGGACVVDNVGGTCFINGECFERNVTSPYNPCAYCNPDVDQNSWTSFHDGLPCLTANATDACSASHDMCMAGVCVDQYLANGTLCRASAGLCDKNEYCTGQSDFCPKDLFQDATVICHSATDVCDIDETCTGNGPDCPDDRVQPNTTVCRARYGPCDLAETCDGVHKTCPVDVFKTSHEVCRESAGPCDKQEMCTGSSAFCPADVHYDSELICRQAAGPCDVEERCTGTGINCPPDVYADVSFACRQAADECDRTEYCTGTSIYCPLDAVQPSGTACRQAQGACDITEYCSGSSKKCPTDRVQSAGTVCRRAVDLCDKEEQCDGQTPNCPDDVFRGPTFQCRSSAGPCDPAEFCTYGNASCPVNVFYNSSVVCRAPAGLCDAVEYCPGGAARCPPDEKVAVGTTCRAAVGVCDKPEVCSGVHDNCPDDKFEPATTVCRESTGPCDTPEFCTSTSVTCPANVFAPTSTVCREPVSVCDLPEYCRVNGTCPEDAVRDSDFVCHLQQSQCDDTAYCNGTTTACEYYPDLDVIGEPCVSTGLGCSTDVCTEVNTCATINTDCSCTVDGNCPVLGECLVGRCLNYQCQKTVVANTCFIDGQCWEANAQNPSNLCEVCKPSLSAYMWMPMPSGTHCDGTLVEGDCSAQDTCNAVGQCIENYLTGKTCRASAGLCDVAEKCVMGNDFCPPDIFYNSSRQCRASAGDCDAPEFCTGTHAYCPSDGFYQSGYMCRASKGSCDDAEYCTGETRNCPEDALSPEGTLCRDAIDTCDKPEYCTGSSSSCPSDKLQPSGWICRPGAGLCDHPETCTGTSHSCPADTLFSAGTVCRYASDLCDEQETCDGSSVDCPVDTFSPVTKACRPAVSSCDRTEYCTGVNKVCPSDTVVPEGIICRYALDVCDIPETCDGLSKYCPTDIYASSWHVCRPAISKCDVEDRCTGNSIRCPVDNKRPNGYSCSDGDFCNGDEYCQDGFCTPADSYRNCSRPSGCSLDSCDELSERCVHTAITGVGQLCYEGPGGTMGVGICKAGVYACDGTGDLVCNGQVLPKPFDFCGNFKDDNCNGQTDEGCHVGPCTTDDECINSPIDTCHIGHCSNQSMCVYHLLPNFCFINDNCYSFNEYKPHNPCQRCYPNASKHEWTQTNQANVSDNNICNGGEYCHDGKVFVDPPPLNCHHLDSPCSEGVCDPASGCYREVTPDNSDCHIPGSTCTVAFTCRGGVCVCDGVLHSDSTNVGLIVGLTVGLPLIALFLIGAGFYTWWSERSKEEGYRKLK